MGTQQEVIAWNKRLVGLIARRLENEEKADIAIPVGLLRTIELCLQNNIVVIEALGRKEDRE